MVPMTAPLIKLDSPSASRSVVFPDWLWERLVQAASAESLKTGYSVGPPDLIRQGAAQRVEAILGKQEAA